MTIATSAPLQIFPNYQQQQNNQSPKYNDSPNCRLQWRRGQLLVRLSQNLKQPNLPSLQSQQWLVECLKNSPVRLVSIDSKLGEQTLQNWAEACRRAKKPVFLRGAFAHTKIPPNIQSQFSFCLSWVAALLLLVVISPVMLAIVTYLRIFTAGKVFSRDWCVAARGKLFRGFKFSTTQLNNSSQSTAIGRWMCKYKLDELPQLFNVLRGEISLVGPHPLTLHDAVLLSSSSILDEGATQVERSGTNKFKKNLQLFLPFLTDQAY